MRERGFWSGAGEAHPVNQVSCSRRRDDADGRESPFTAPRIFSSSAPTGTTNNRTNKWRARLSLRKSVQTVLGCREARLEPVPAQPTPLKGPGLGFMNKGGERPSPPAGEGGLRPSHPHLQLLGSRKSGGRGEGWGSSSMASTAARRGNKHTTLRTPLPRPSGVPPAVEGRGRMARETARRNIARPGCPSPRADALSISRGSSGEGGGGRLRQEDEDGRVSGRPNPSVGYEFRVVRPLYPRKNIHSFECVMGAGSQWAFSWALRRAKSSPDSLGLCRLCGVPS